MALAKSVLAMVTALVASQALAQQSPMPEDLAWKLTEIGRVIDPPKTAALYAPLQQKERIRASRPNATSNTARPIGICSTSLRRRRIQPRGRC